MAAPTSSSASASNVWQEILSLDAKYNLYRINSSAQLRTQYMRRRTQLMREYSARMGSRPEVLAERRVYLNVRAQVLERRYGQPDQASLASGHSGQRGVYVNRPTHQKADSVSLSSEFSNYGKRYSSLNQNNNNSNVAAALNPHNSFLYSSKESLGAAAVNTSGASARQANNR
jgi:hypothetical protein